MTKPCKKIPWTNYLRVVSCVRIRRTELISISDSSRGSSQMITTKVPRRIKQQHWPFTKMISNSKYEILCWDNSVLSIKAPQLVLNISCPDCLHNMCPKHKASEFTIKQLKWQAMYCFSTVKHGWSRVKTFGLDTPYQSFDKYTNRHIRTENAHHVWPRRYVNTINIYREHVVRNFVFPFLISLSYLQHFHL